MPAPVKLSDLFPKSTEIQITPHWWGWEGGSGEDGNLNGVPFIYGDRIVCEAESATGNYYIYLYDLSNSISQTIGLTDEAYLPAIYGDKIVWEDRRNGNPDIYIFTLTSAEIPDSELTPLDSIKSLKEYVESIHEHHAKTKNSLIALLDNSMRQYEKGKYEKAVSMLESFIHLVEKMKVSKQISADEADYMVREVKKIIDQIEAN